MELQKPVARSDGKEGSIQVKFCEKGWALPSASTNASEARHATSRRSPRDRCRSPRDLPASDRPRSDESLMWCRAYLSRRPMLAQHPIWLMFWRFERRSSCRSSATGRECRRLLHMGPFKCASATCRTTQRYWEHDGSVEAIQTVSTPGCRGPWLPYGCRFLIMAAACRVETATQCGASSSAGRPSPEGEASPRTVSPSSQLLSTPHHG